MVSSEQAENKQEKDKTERGQKRKQGVVDERSKHQPKKLKRDPGSSGPPMRVSYKGEVRSLHDGAGLCSPGRWPVSKRAHARSEREASTRRWFEEAFTSWTSTVGEDKAKEIFWAMAGGKLHESPFGEEMDELKRRLDEHLGRWGMEPKRMETDRSSEINFRRLRALAEVMEDEDYIFLEEVASKGVRLGVDMEMPRTPEVYEEKFKWTVDATDEVMRDILAENYESTEENSEDIERQVLQEVEKGTIIRMMEHEAKRRFKGRLAVAALGAVPKELGTKRVRLIHDQEDPCPRQDEVSLDRRRCSHLEAGRGGDGGDQRWCPLLGAVRHRQGPQASACSRGGLGAAGVQAAKGQVG